MDYLPFLPNTTLFMIHSTKNSKVVACGLDISGGAKLIKDAFVANA